MAGCLGLLPHPGPATAQELLPRAQDAAVPGPGEVWFRGAPFFQAWHEEFGTDGGRVPLADALDGPLLERIHPGPAAVLAPLNRDAEALGFSPLSPEEAAVGNLDVREIGVNSRSAAVTVEIGMVEGLSMDVMVPFVRTEVEPFLSFDPAGATLAGAAAAVPDPASFFGQIGDARDDLRARLEGGQLSPSEEERARELLEASGAFADALRPRVEENGLLPLAGTRAGEELAAFYAGLRSGFQDFGLLLPGLSLPATGDSTFLNDFFLGTLAAPAPGITERGWLAGEPEIGFRYRLLSGFREEEGGLQLRTTVGARARLPIRDANSEAFVQPSDFFGIPLGDGQRDLEVTVYQDLRWGRWLAVDAFVRYGAQLADVLRVRVRSPDRPFALPDQLRRVERDLGDYVRVRVSPRLRLHPSVSVGTEYRYWHKQADVYRDEDGGERIRALELQTERTRHRLGLTAVYRPAPAQEGEGEGSAAELGFTYQTAFAGSGGQTPAAGLVTLHVRLPVRAF